MKKAVSYNFNLKKTKRPMIFHYTGGGPGTEEKCSSFYIAFPIWKNSPEIWKTNTNRKM